jgi:hypothetical protein
MRERRMSDGTSFSPQTQNVFREAYDEAWKLIADKFSADEIEHARDQLAEVVMSIAREDSADVARIREAAIRAMERQYPIQFKSLDVEHGQIGGEGPARREVTGSTKAECFHLLLSWAGGA